MQKFYVSLVEDLLGYYLEFEADCELTVRKYLEHEYYRNEVWKLPWCTIYDLDQFMEMREHRSSIKAKCGPLESWMFEG